MRLMSNKPLAVGGLILVTTALLVGLSSFLGDSGRQSVFWPKIGLKNLQETQNAEEYVTEKIVQTQRGSTDMRSDLYLTHHRYLLENIAKIEVKYRQKTYTLNDVCFKPHSAIFEGSNTLRRPYYMERLFLEMQRLSPCLITTPLNCFYDSFHIHSQISRWNQSTDYLNRRLRNAYIEALKEGEPRVYVKATYGLDIIKEWAGHMIHIATEKHEKERGSWSESIRRWISSIEPRRKVCADPMRSCDQAPDAENYFNICMVMQHMNDFEEKRRQKLKFELEESDEEFTTKLDCVEDREKFIEWMQERELKGILKTFVPGFNLPDHQQIVKQRCDGIFHDEGSDGIEFFDGSRTFSGEDESFDSIRTELALMTPESLQKNMEHADFVNGHESMWNLERSAELLEEFRFALRAEVTKFNAHRASRKIGVTSRVVNDVPEKEEKHDSWKIQFYFLFFGSLALLVIFTCFVWSSNPFRSLSMLAIRSVVTAFLYISFCNKNGVLILDGTLLGDFVLFILVNLFVTSAISLSKGRLSRYIRRLCDSMNPTSNFSSINTVGSLQGNPRRAMHVHQEYNNHQTGQDADSHEKFERMSNFWFLLAVPLCLLLTCYWFFFDQQLHVLFILVAPSVLIGSLELFKLKKNFINEKKQFKAEAQKFQEAAEATMTEEEMTNRLGTRNEQESRNAIKKSTMALNPLSGDQYNVSCMSPPTSITNRFRLLIVYLYFELLAAKGIFIRLFVIFAALCGILAAALLFVPVSRASEDIKSLEYDDLFLDIAISDFSANWGTQKSVLMNFSSDLESLPRLQVVTNWENGFERFEKRMVQNTSFADWMNQEPISWIITASRRTAPDQKNRLPNPFRFRFRYEIENSRNESLMAETIQNLDDIISKYSQSSGISIRAVGLVYEHYHRNAIAWNSFSTNQLLTDLLLLLTFCIIVQLFATTPTIRSNLLFSFFVVATRIETSAVVYIFSVDNYALYLNFATVIAFLFAYPGFSDTCRFRSRVLLEHKHNRDSPELKTGRRIRVPFIAFVDTVHVLGALISVCTCLAAASTLHSDLRVFFAPIVIFIGIQLVALFNAVVISVVTRLMFEPKVLIALNRDLGLKGDSSSRKFQKMFEKRPNLPITPPDSPPGMELIEQVKIPYFHAPPPRSRKRSKDEKPENEEERDEMLGPSTSSSQSPGSPNDLEAARSSVPKKDTPLLGRILPSCGLLGREPWHTYRFGASFDSRINYEEVAEAEDVYETGEGDQYTYRLPDEWYLLNRQQEPEESSEEDVMSTGEPDEEVARVVAEMEARQAQQRDADQNVPGSIDAPMEVEEDDDSQPGPSNRPPRHANQMEADLNSDDEPSGLCASPSPPPADVAPAAQVQLAAAPVLNARLPQRRYMRVEPIIRREHPRDPLTEPPIILEYIQEFDDPDLPAHPRADQYPSNFSFAQVAYCEDPYWKHNRDNLPPGVEAAPLPDDLKRLIAQQALDQLQRPVGVGEPEDFDYQPDPADPPPLPIPPPAMELFEERREEHRRDQQRGNN